MNLHVAMRTALAPLALFVGACTHAVPPSAHVAGLGPAAWDRLKTTLPGAWTMPSKSGAFVVSYKVISGGSVLVEEWGPGTPHETETVFHPDHGDVLLTHYCAQGNQPRLRVEEITPDTIVFRFVDVTNRGPDQAMLVERRLHFTDGAFDDTETYRTPEGKDDVTTYHFTRAAHGE